MFTPVSGSLLDHFTTLKDPRQSAKVLYPSARLRPPTIAVLARKRFDI
jgi:hypothetical protein